MGDYIQKNSYGVFIDRTIRKVKKDLENRFKTHNLGITVDQFVILDRLAPNDGINPMELAEITFKDSPTITRLSNNLEKKNLITRELDKNDRRKFNIYITKKGKEKLEEALPIVLENRKAGWKGLDGEDYNHLKRIMETIYNNY
ncbi:MarR family winged helix-turn-helix transcriptional regulator [Aquimarina aquimarini]|uniref:MarR family winged helix-turn-helix transcriptional regulator n=1 Tax=Aquimarina aquimarini TaxID=1191734 RepID=UPI00131F20A1|nr:MarR family transcriptional regulator [Aquimarina aquimarini]